MSQLISRIPFTIANGASLSDGQSLGGRTPAIIMMSAAWTAASLTFQGSHDGTTYYDLYITGRPGEVVLVQEGKAPLRAATPEDLELEQLGYDLPVAKLRYWIKGVPAPEGRSTPSFNAENHLIALEQDGWTVQYLGYTNYATESLPTRIRIEKPPLRLDFVRLDWTLQGTP